MSVTEVNGRIVINTKVTSQDPPIEGRHPLRIETVEVKEAGENAKNPGSQYLNMRLRVIDGPDKGKTVFQNFQLDGGYRFLFEHLCLALEVANQEAFAIEDFVGGDFEAELKHTEFNGRKSAEIKKIFYATDETSGSGVDKKNFPF